MRVSMDWYSYHTSRPQLMQVVGPPLVKDYNFNFYFVFLTHRLSFLFTAPYADLWTTVHKTIYFSYIYLAYKCLRTCTHIACSQVHSPQHTHTLSWPLFESHLSLCASSAPTRKPLPRSIPRMYWYVWEPSTPSILCGWPLNLFPLSRHEVLLMPPQSVDHTGVAFKLFFDSLKQWKDSRAQLLPFPPAKV